MIKKILKGLILTIFVLVSISLVGVYTNIHYCQNFADLNKVITDNNLKDLNPCVESIDASGISKAIENTLNYQENTYANQAIGLTLDRNEDECALDDIICQFSNPTSLKKDSKGRTNLFIAGVDARKDRSNKLTDTMLLVSYDHNSGKSLFISFPRDLYIYYQRINGVNTSYKLNAVYAIDGIRGLNYTIEQITNLKIHYYAYVNLDAFTKAMDSLGTVKVYLDKDFRDLYPCTDVPSGITCKSSYSRAYGEFRFPKGWNEFDTFDSLVYTRARMYSSDFDRARRQQNLIKYIIKDVNQDMENILSNLTKYIDLYSNMQSDIQTNVQIEEIFSVFKLISRNNDYEPIQMTLDTSTPFIYYMGIKPGVGYSIGFRDTSHKTFQNHLNSVLTYLPFQNLKKLKIATISVEEKSKIGGNSHFSVKHFTSPDNLGSRIYNLGNIDETAVNFFKSKYDLIEYNSEIDAELLNEYQEYDLVIFL